MQRLVYLKNVVTLTLKEDKCNGCGMCLKVCPHEVFGMSGHKAFIIDKDYCMECGACQGNCPTGAIQVDSGVGCAWAMFSAALTGKGG